MESVQSRPATEADETFLFDLFASTRAGVLEPANLPPQALRSLLRAQYAGRRRTYDARFRDAERSILLHEGAPVGAIVVSRTQAEIRLVDVALLPRHRGAGIGTRLVRALQEEARRSRRPLRLSVDPGNPGARRLYARLGFEEVERSATDVGLVWRARG